MEKPDIGLIEVFCSITDAAVMDRFFSEIFTDSERKDLFLRWELMKRLRDKVPQRQ
ncbi:trp operon repressor, partial [Myxococcota bacterium]|nr:trp operon repressor [Myxococcota bacterium]